MPVHLLPGERDPASLESPQPPLSGAMFPRASQSQSFFLHANPSRFDIEGIEYDQMVNEILTDSSSHDVNLVFSCLLANP